MEEEKETLRFPIRGKVKSKTRVKTEYWFVRVLLVLIPAFFSYLTARSAAESKAKALAKENSVKAQTVNNKAEAGYDELMKAIQHLDEELKNHNQSLWEMKGRIAAFETRRPAVRPTGPTPVGPGTDRDGILDQPAAAPPEMRPLQIAPNLDQAAQKRLVPPN
jgi:seryl-tRNA synthetase